MYSPSRKCAGSRSQKIWQTGIVVLVESGKDRISEILAAIDEWVNGI